MDSNFLLVPSQFQMDIFEELTALLRQRIDPVILSPIYEELVKIAERGAPKMQRYASLALGLTKKCRLVLVEQKVEESTDDVITRIAAEWKTPVATNDRDLRRRLRDVGVAVIYLRQKARLEIDGNIP